MHKKEFQIKVKYTQRIFYHLFFANLRIERRNNEAIRAKVGVKSHRLHTGLFQSNLEKNGAA